MFRVGQSEKSRERRKVFASHPEHYSGGKFHNSPPLLSHVCPAALSFDGYFDFENGTAEIVKLADWDTVKSNVFAKTAIQFVQGLPAGRLPKKVVVLVCYL